MTPQLGDWIRIHWPDGWAHGRAFIVRSIERIERPTLKPYWVVEVMEHFAPDGGDRRIDYGRDTGPSKDVRFLFPVEWCQPVRPGSPGQPAASKGKSR